MAQFLVSLAHQPSEELFLATILVNYLTLQGHTCVDLATQAEQPFPPFATAETTLRCPPLTPWLTALQQSHVVGEPGDYTPLILDHTRLYLYRYWHYEQHVLHSIQTRCQQPPIPINFDLSRCTEPQAAQCLLSQYFSILSGGPGSGKTTMILTLLVLLLEHQQSLRIALAAPTGKAAQRLQHQLQEAAETVKTLLPTQTYTLHRLLGSRPHSPYFIHDANNLLPYDIVIVDEASMVDLALMAKLAQAIPLSARWILVGDPHQLTSVASGSVFSDLCQATAHHPLLAARRVSLTQNYRFRAESGIQALAQAVNAGAAEQAMQLLQSKHYEDIDWQPLHQDHLPKRLTDPILKGFTPYLTAKTPQDALAAFEHFRVLSPLRQGPYGIIALNQWIEHILQAKGFIQLNYYWYIGRPVMITRNHYPFNLFNGDSGLIWWSSEGQQEVQAYFPTAEPTVFWPQQLPEHETAYAMTIHKSQGSEFDEVLVILPEMSSSLLTRELIYTAITRARHKLTFWGSEAVLKAAIAQHVVRTSGVVAALNTDLS